MTDSPSLNDLVLRASSDRPGASDALARFISQHRTGEVLDTKRAASYCGLAPRTLHNLATLGTGPFRHKHGRKTVYYPVDLDVFLAGRVRPATSQAA